MSTYVLGISALYHDAAAAIVRDGEILAAAQEERFSRQKHDARFPVHAINYCLEEAGLDVEHLDAIVFYDNPLLTWDRVVTTCVAAGEPSRAQFAKAARSMLGGKVWVQSMARKALGGLGRSGRLLTAEHHRSHAASAFYPSPFDRAAIVTIDGVGEWATTTVGTGTGQQIDLLVEIDYPHSLGLLYSAFTYFCGFQVNDGEYKLMGLAPYGKPRYAQLILDELISLKPDGSFRLNTDYFGYVAGSEMTNEKFEALFGGPRRAPDAPVTRREMDMAASIQAVLEEGILRIARYARRESGARNLVMAGGVALNCVANGKLVKAGVFDELWVQPAASDAGGALGAALLVTHEYFGLPRSANTGADKQRGDYLGPAFTSAEVAAFLARHDLPHRVVNDVETRAGIVAQALSEGKIVGHFSGRMEFGPRALGSRSILADPRNERMQAFLNMQVKFRESFRPFAPAVLQERAAEYFDLPCASPYMLLVAGVKEKHRRAIPDRTQDDGDLDVSILQTPRSDVPAVTHVDYSARIQTIDPANAPELYAIVEAFDARTGCPMVINTSFNVRDEPIVCTPRDAYRCFMGTGMDLLVIGDCLLWKADLPEPSQSTERPAFEEAILLLDAELTRVKMAQLDSADLEREIDLLFEEAVLRLNRNQASDLKSLVPMHADFGTPSYYVRCVTGAGTGEYESVTFEDTEGFAAALHKLWDREKRTAYLGTIPHHAKVASLAAKAWCEVPIPESIYAMF